MLSTRRSNCNCLASSAPPHRTHGLHSKDTHTLARARVCEWYRAVWASVSQPYVGLSFVSLWMPDAFRMCLSSVPVGIITTNNNRTSSVSCPDTHRHRQHRHTYAARMRMTLWISPFFCAFCSSLPAACCLHTIHSPQVVAETLYLPSCPVSFMYNFSNVWIQDEEDDKMDEKKNPIKTFYW